MVELLRAADPLVYGFSQAIVWSGKATLNQIEDRPWLVQSCQLSNGWKGYAVLCRQY
jgi:hypothetical protein